MRRLSKELAGKGVGQPAFGAPSAANNGPKALAKGVQFGANLVENSTSKVSKAAHKAVDKADAAMHEAATKVQATFRGHRQRMAGFGHWQCTCNVAKGAASMAFTGASWFTCKASQSLFLILNNLLLKILILYESVRS